LKITKTADFEQVFLGLASQVIEALRMQDEMILGTAASSLCKNREGSVYNCQNEHPHRPPALWHRASLVFSLRQRCEEIYGLFVLAMHQPHGLYAQSRQSLLKWLIVCTLYSEMWHNLSASLPLWWQTEIFQ